MPAGEETHAMPSQPLKIPDEETELLGETLTFEQLARCCAVSTEWLHTHVESGVLLPQDGSAAPEWRFASATLVRVRRIVQLEQTYDADPQLAALAADLMEEVARLRRQLRSG